MKNWALYTVSRLSNSTLDYRTSYTITFVRRNLFSLLRKTFLLFFFLFTSLFYQRRVDMNEFCTVMNECLFDRIQFDESLCFSLMWYNWIWLRSKRWRKRIFVKIHQRIYILTSTTLNTSAFWTFLWNKITLNLNI